METHCDLTFLSVGKRVAIATLSICAIWLIVLWGRAIHHQQPGAGRIADPQSITIAHMCAVSMACKEFKRRAGMWPPSVIVLSNTIAVKDSSIFLDGWGREYTILRHTNAPGIAWLVSYGSRGSSGGPATNEGAIMELK